MEIIDPQQKREFEKRNQFTPGHGQETKGRILAGLVIIIVGGLILAQRMGVYFPHWLFSWQTLLIVIGVFIGAKHNFRPGGWLVPILIGSIFLMDDFLPDFNIRAYSLPLILIVVGLVMILTPGRRRRLRQGWNNYNQQPNTAPAMDSGEEVMDSVSIFGGVKKNIITKSFRGGEAVTIFGGTEINLMQADFQGKVKLEIVQIFGGTKLIIPANWQIQSEMVTILGDIQDSRISTKESISGDKILVIEGFSMFGGISVKSY